MARIPELLWLWCWPAATALIRPLAWETPYANGMALKRKKGKEKEQQLSQVERKVYGTSAYSRGLVRDLGPLFFLHQPQSSSLENITCKQDMAAASNGRDSSHPCNSVRAETLFQSHRGAPTRVSLAWHGSHAPAESNPISRE